MTTIHVMLRAILLLLIMGLPLVAQTASGLIVREAVFHIPTDRLDPHREFWLPWDPIYRCVYETPLRCDPQSDDLTLECHLLTSMPVMKEGGKVLRLHFKKGIRFQDDACFKNGKGRILTATDFAFVLKRHIDPQTASPYYGAYLEGFLLGARRARAAAVKDGFFDYDAEVPGIKVIDEQTVELHFLRPCSRFPSLLTMTWMALIPREAVRKYGSGIGAHPVGTGPYRFNEAESTTSKMIFTRRADYWNRDAGGEHGPLPWNAAVEFELLPDLGVQEKRFADGDLTVIDLYPVQFERLLTRSGRLRPKTMPRGTRLLSVRDDKLQYIAFNTKNKILGKRAVRRALALALDRRRLVKSYFAGHGDLSQHLCPPAISLPGAESSTWLFGKRDIKQARSLLAEAGYPGGAGLPEFILEAPSIDPWEKALAENLKAAWARIGVKVQIRLQSYQEQSERARRGLCEISINYWQSDYPDPDNFFMMLTRGSWPAPGKLVDSPNIGYWYHEEYEKLYARTLTMPVGQDRNRIFGEMIGIMQKDVPWVFGGHKRQIALVQKGVRGIQTRSRYARSYERVMR